MHEGGHSKQISYARVAWQVKLVLELAMMGWDDEASHF